MKKLITTLAIVMFTATTIYAGEGPFGLTFGVPIQKQVKTYEEIKPNLFKIYEVPKPFHMFEYYLARSTPECGLTYVKALTPDIICNDYGTETKTKYNDLKKILDEKYTGGKEFDFIRPDSIWSEPHEWSMSLKKEHRCLATLYPQKSAEDFELCMIAVVAVGLSASKSCIAVEYETNAHERCKDQANKKGADAL